MSAGRRIGRASRSDLRATYLRPIMIGTVLFGPVAWLVLGDFGANLFADAIAAAFAIYVIDEVTARAERHRLKNMAATMYAKLFSIRSTLFHLFEKFAGAALEPTDAAAVERAATMDDMDALAAILGRVHSHELAGWIARPRTMKFDVRCRWGDVLREELQIVSTEIDNFIAQFGQFTPPDLVAILGTIARPQVGVFLLRDGSPPLPHLSPRLWRDLLRANQRLGVEIQNMKDEFGVTTEPDHLDQRSLDPALFVFHNFRSFLEGQHMYRDAHASKPTSPHIPYVPGFFSSGRGKRVS